MLGGALLHVSPPQGGKGQALNTYGDVFAGGRRLPLLLLHF